MISVIDEIRAVRLETIALHFRITKADCFNEVRSFESDVLALMWRLETDDRVSKLDIDNLGVVFTMALKSRRHELTF
ncbi:hypothetical protein AA957_00580 [Pseudomonas trivialis]|uniref:Uncharacterized protein n=1 Tax=Pseudomonas trivialis TaxID=200450 RepID=A0A0H5A588_9PSED|nr:hypothetical protein AA957_00580 [Pseudomonas trivialis]